jgi:hypothetical protein
MYLVHSEWDVDVDEQYTQKQLVDQLGNNYDRTCREFGKTDVKEFFIPHLMAENPKIKDIISGIKDSSLELIGTLNLLSQRKTFKGTCPICKDW